MQQAIRQKLEQDFKEKPVLVVGLGLQGGGVGLAQFLSRLGAYVTVTDLKSEEELSPSLEKLKDLKIEYRLGGHKVDDFLSADFIFKGPSVPWDLPEIVKAQEKGILVDMETSYMASFLSKQIIGITGTRGKSTTAQLIFEILKTAGKDVVLGGNVKDVSTIQLLNKVTENTIIVLELSSWQLSGFLRRKISPHVSVFTSFYPDHLNYYKTMDEYFYDKSAIYKYQKTGDLLVAQQSLKDKIGDLRSHIQYYSVYLDKMAIKGDHNRENAAGALLVAKAFEIDDELIKKVLADFQGIPYRQENIRTIGETTFINDTTSTTPVSTIKAVQTFDNNPTALILGGTTKNLPSRELIDSLGSIVTIVLLKGSFTEEIEKSLREKYGEKVSGVYNTLKEAVDAAYTSVKTKKNSFVLLSPGAASFGLFKNEFHRGEEFNKIVRAL